MSADVLIFCALIDTSIMFKNLPVLQGKGFHSNTLNKWNDKKTISDTCVITLVQCVCLMEQFLEWCTYTLHGF